MPPIVPAGGDSPGYRAQAEDTTVEIDKRLFDAYREMPSVEKVRRMTADTLALEQLSRAGIRERHPEAGAHELRLRVAALRLDRDTMIRVFGWDPEARGY